MEVIADVRGTQLSLGVKLDAIALKSSDKKDYPTLIEIWEASVRATHDFLAEEDILALKPIILEQYFDAVHLKHAKDNAGNLLGFCGTDQDNIEMLFVLPEARGLGVGSFLAYDAIKQHGATKVDVNEQNRQAIGFYAHLGFRVIDRSSLDGQGKPYPLLHMALAGVEK